MSADFPGAYARELIAYGWFAADGLEDVVKVLECAYALLEEDYPGHGRIATIKGRPSRGWRVTLPTRVQDA